MTIRIIESKAINYVNNQEKLHKYQSEIDKIKLNLAKLKGEEKELQNNIAAIKKNQEESLNEQKRKVELIIQEKEKQVEEVIQQAQKKAKEIIDNAKAESRNIQEESEAMKQKNMAEVDDKKNVVFEDSKEAGYQEGFEKGFALGEKERDKINALLKKVFQETITKRDEMIQHFESHLLDIALLIARKVVKKLTEEQKGIVVNNLLSALKKLKGAVKVVVHLNSEDLEVVNHFKKRIIDNIADLKEVEIVEDPMVEKGGCLVESNYTIIDANIASQLNKIEEVIKNESPLKVL